MLSLLLWRIMLDVSSSEYGAFNEQSFINVCLASFFAFVSTFYIYKLSNDRN